MNWEQRPGWTELEDIMIEQATRKIGLTAEQFNFVMHNLRYLKNNLGLANIELGEIKTTYTAPGTAFDVDITHREVIYGEGISTIGSYIAGDKIDFLDFHFYIAVTEIQATATAELSEDDTNTTSVELRSSQLESLKGYKFDFKFIIPRGIQGLKGVSFRNRGNYDETATYLNNDTYIDFVYYQGNSYCPIVEETTAGVLPTDTTEWTIMAQRGCGISNIEETGVAGTETDGIERTYTITLEDGHTYTFVVKDGKVQDISGKADKVVGAIAGNFVAFDENGNIKDSNIKPTDKEDSKNKTSEITEENMESADLYPTIGAMTKYVDDLLGEIAEDLDGV